MFEFLYHNNQGHATLYVNPKSITGSILTPYYSGQFYNINQFKDVLKMLEADYKLKKIYKRGGSK